MLHHHPVLKRAKELIDTGAVGRILSVRAEAGFTCHNGTPGRTIEIFTCHGKPEEEEPFSI